MDVFQSAAGDETIYPDDIILQQSLEELERLAETSSRAQPFFLAVGFIRPHLPFGAPQESMQPYRDVELPPIPHPDKPLGKTTWHGSGEFMKYQRWQRDPNQDHDFADQVRKHYAACVSYTDALIGKLLERLDTLELRDETIVVLWGDHGWHLGEHAIWGKHSLFEESLRSPLIISYAGLPDPGAASDAVVESIDLFPTLCELTGLPRAEFCQGTSLVPVLDAPQSQVKVGAVSYFGNRQTIRTSTHRLIRHADGHVELYDHTSPLAETANVAEQQPDVVELLTSQLRQRLNRD